MENLEKKIMQSTKYNRQLYKRNKLNKKFVTLYIYTNMLQQSLMTRTNQRNTVNTETD